MSWNFSERALTASCFKVKEGISPSFFFAEIPDQSKFLTCYSTVLCYTGSTERDAEEHSLQIRTEYIMAINRVIITGHLTRDPELRTTVSGTPVMGFGIAINDRRKNQQTGEWEDYPNFVDCTVFGNRADALNKFLRKGMKVGHRGQAPLEPVGARRSEALQDRGDRRRGGGYGLEAVERRRSGSRSSGRPDDRSCLRRRHPVLTSISRQETKEGICVKQMPSSISHSNAKSGYC